MTTPQLMIRCPKTGRAIPTGVAMAPASFVTSGMENNSSVCPACREAHLWSKENTSWESESHN